jgi:SPP1 gp7 family putative phage head morphogenesis protein
MRYPLAQEIQYRVILNTLIRAVTAALKKYVAPYVRGWAVEATAVDLPTGPIRQDVEGHGWREQMTAALQRAFLSTQREQQEAIRKMIDVGKRTDTYNEKEWRRLIRSAYGVDPIKEDPKKYQPLLDKWADTNARLITNIPQKTMEQIQEQSMAALTEGTSVADTTARIYEIMSERVDVSYSRAQLIARDQVAKLNGQFTRERQEDLGVDSYIWRTVQDERVRETHQEVDGQTFPWDKPPEETDGNHPGEDYQCRCWAEPILPERMAFEASLQEEEDALDEAA